MTADELQALLAAAAPGTRVTIVTIEVPSPPAPDTAVPKPWTPPDGVLAQAPAIAERTEPFTSGELAAVLRVQPETVGVWCRRGLLPGATRMGGAGWRIPPSAVLAMLGGAAATVGSDGASPSAGAAAGAPVAPPTAAGVTASGGLPAAAAAGAAGAGGGAATADDEAFDPASFGSWRAQRAKESR